jgi:heme exporter protein A
MDAPRSTRLSKVTARDVTKLFGATPALRGADLDLLPGEITLLTGPNGAGKSTLLGIVGTQLKPTRGRVEYVAEDGRPLGRGAVRAQLGWVSHASHCYAEMSGRQNVELCATLHGVSTDRYGPLAERLGLGRFAERPVRTLSRGQTQRVALARALIHAPKLLLLDEPWTGLDRRSGQVLEEVVLAERDKGALIAIVSHEPHLAARLGAKEIQVVRGQTRVNSAA